MSALLILAFPLVGFAISETNYKDLYLQKVKPFYFSGESGKFVSKDGFKLAYKAFIHPKPRAHLVVTQGWTDDTRKYDEFFYDLYHKGVSIYALDWRGQGFSQRFDIGDDSKSYIEDYDQYVDDLESFIDNVVRKKTQEPLIAFGHSMGANILSLYMVKHPQIFARAIYSSPMLDIKTGFLPETAAWLIAAGMDLIGFGDSFIFGQDTMSPY